MPWTQDRTASHSSKVASASTYRSVTFISSWVIPGVKSGRSRRYSALQAQANRRNFRSLVLPRRDSSIIRGSPLANHSASVISSPLVQLPLADVLLHGPRDQVADAH